MQSPLYSPYTGITGVTSRKEVEELRRAFGVFQGYRKNPRRFRVGVMMNRKTLHGYPTEETDTFLSPEDIPKIFFSDKTMNCLCYVDEESDPNLLKNLYLAIQYCGIYLDTLQLDMVWPDPVQISNAVHASRKPLSVILQIGRNAIDEVGQDPSRLVERLQDYCVKGYEVIHYVLLDMSMGRGIDLDPDELLPYARVIRDNFPGLRIAIAGGLGPDTFDLVRPLLVEFPDLCIDAHTKVRKDNDAKQSIDIAKALAYLKKSCELFELGL